MKIKKEKEKTIQKREQTYPTWRDKELEGATASFDLKTKKLRDQDLIERLNKREGAATEFARVGRRN